MSGAEPALVNVTFYTILITTNICMIDLYYLSHYDDCLSLFPIGRFIHIFLNVCPFESTTVTFTSLQIYHKKHTHTLGVISFYYA